MINVFEKEFDSWFEEKKEKNEVYGNGDDFWVDDEIKKFCKMGFDFGCQTVSDEIIRDLLSVLATFKEQIVFDDDKQKIKKAEEFLGL